MMLFNNFTHVVNNVHHTVCEYVMDYGVCTIIILLVYTGPVAVKKLNVSNPNESQFQAFKNEVQVLR